MSFLIILVLLTLCRMEALNGELRVVGDEDLLQLIRTKEKLIVLFSKDNCATCVKFSKELENLEDDFFKHMNAETVETANSHIARLYSPTKEPAVVFFRHGVPLLYNGEPNMHEMYPFFEQNQEPVVKELTDKIFEHITQVATGATTGDWLVMFYGASCVECQRLHAVWEGVGAALRGRINVARVDASVAGANTAKRFKVNKLPTFLFFRLGKVYKYDLPKTDIKSFTGFAQDWYKNAKGEPVAVLSSPFDDLVDFCVEQIKHTITLALEVLNEHPWIWQIGLVGFGLVAITAIIALIKAERSRPVKEKKEKKRK